MRHRVPRPVHPPVVVALFGVLLVHTVERSRLCPSARRDQKAHAVRFHPVAALLAFFRPAACVVRMFVTVPSGEIDKRATVVRSTCFGARLQRDESVHLRLAAGALAALLNFRERAGEAVEDVAVVEDLPERSVCGACAERVRSVCGAEQKSGGQKRGK